MIKILAIGNSFSQDATHYLHQLAEADGVDMKVSNLYIGGCNLERHWNNIKNEAQDYLYEENGNSSGEYCSIQQILAMEEWDYIVTQQASPDSGIIETYEPYIGFLWTYLREKAPKAELLLHETWAYEIDSGHPGFERYGFSQQEMYHKLADAYKKTAERTGSRLIPCGDVIQHLRTKEPFAYNEGGMSVCRDGFHMNVIYGRYLLAATWYKFLVGKSIKNNTYIPSTKLAPNVMCNERILGVVKETIDEMV